MGYILKRLPHTTAAYRGGPLQFTKKPGQGLKFRDNLVSLPYMYYGGQNNSFKN